jgi:hypothetical protein
LVRRDRPEDWPGLQELAAEVLASTRTRFTADPHLPLGAARRLYAEWAAESRNGRFADLRLVAESPSTGECAGFAFARSDPELTRVMGEEVGRLTLGGVRPESREQGAFGALFAAILFELWERGTRFVHLTTQAHNAGVVALAHRLGAEVGGSYHCLRLVI